MALVFDTLSAARVLQSKGFTAQQAEGIAEQMNQLLIHDLATRSDLEAQRHALKGDIDWARAELKGDIDRVHGELKSDIDGVRGGVTALSTSTASEFKAVRSEMKAMESALTVKMYTVGFAVVALVVAAQKLLP